MQRYLLHRQHRQATAGGARVYMLRHIGGREEVRDNGREQGSILNQEFGHVAVAHGHDQHHCFIYACTFASLHHVLRCFRHRYDSSRHGSRAQCRGRVSKRAHVHCWQSSVAGSFPDRLQTLAYCTCNINHLWFWTGSFPCSQIGRLSDRQTVCDYVTEDSKCCDQLT